MLVTPGGRENLFIIKAMEGITLIGGILQVGNGKVIIGQV